MNKSQLEHMINICGEMQKADALNLLSFILSQKEPGPLMMNIANGQVTSHNLIDQNKIFAESILAFWKLMQAKQLTTQDDDELLNSAEIEKKLRAAQQILLDDPALQATKAAPPKSIPQQITIIANPKTLDAIKTEYETKFKNETFFKPDHSTPGQSTLAFPNDESAMLFFAEIAQTDPTKSFSVHNKGKLVAKANGGKLWAVNTDGTIGKEYYSGQFVPPINTQASSPTGSPKPLERKNQKKNNRPQNTANFSNQANASAGSPKPLEPKIKKIKTPNRRRPTEHSTYVNKSNPISFGQSSPNNDFQDIIHNELAALQDKLRQNNLHLLKVERDIQAILNMLNGPFTPHQRQDITRQVNLINNEVDDLVANNHSRKQQYSWDDYLFESEPIPEVNPSHPHPGALNKTRDTEHSQKETTQAHKNVMAELQELLKARAEQALKAPPPQPNDTNQEPKQNKATTSHADALNKTRETEHPDNKNAHAPKTTSVQAYEHMLAEAKANLKKRPETDFKDALSQPRDTNQEHLQNDGAGKEGWVKSRIAALNNLKPTVEGLSLTSKNERKMDEKSFKPETLNMAQGIETALLQSNINEIDKKLIQSFHDKILTLINTNPEQDADELSEFKTYLGDKFDSDWDEEDIMDESLETFVSCLANICVEIKNDSSPTIEYFKKDPLFSKLVHDVERTVKNGELSPSTDPQTIENIIDTFSSDFFNSQEFFNFRQLVQNENGLPHGNPAILEKMRNDAAGNEGEVKSATELNNLKSDFIAGENPHNINAQSLSQPEGSSTSISPPKQQNIDSPLQQPISTNSLPPIDSDLRAEIPQPDVNTSEPSSPSVATRIQNSDFLNGVAESLQTKQKQAAATLSEPENSTANKNTNDVTSVATTTDELFELEITKPPTPIASVEPLETKPDINEPITTEPSELDDDEFDLDSLLDVYLPETLEALQSEHNQSNDLITNAENIPEIVIAAREKVSELFPEFDPTSNNQELSAFLRNISRKLHPDRGGDLDVFQTISAAIDVCKEHNNNTAELAEKNVYLENAVVENNKQPEILDMPLPEHNQSNDLITHAENVPEIVIAARATLSNLFPEFDPASNNQELSAFLRNISRKLHPDRGGDLDVFQTISAAIDVCKEHNNNTAEPAEKNVYLENAVVENNQQMEESDAENYLLVINQNQRFGRDDKDVKMNEFIDKWTQKIATSDLNPNELNELKTIASGSIVSLIAKEILDIGTTDRPKAQAIIQAMANVPVENRQHILDRYYTNNDNPYDALLVQQRWVAPPSSTSMLTRFFTKTDRYLNENGQVIEDHPNAASLKKVMNDAESWRNSAHAVSEDRLTTRAQDEQTITKPSTQIPIETKISNLRAMVTSPSGNAIERTPVENHPLATSQTDSASKTQESSASLTAKENQTPSTALTSKQDQCLTLLKAINDAQRINDTDKKMDDFQTRIKNEINSKTNLADLDKIKNNLDSYTSANKMLEAIMKQLVFFETPASYDWGKNDKATKILNALREVPVEDRALLFSDYKSKTQAVINVENACAEHRMPFMPSAAQATTYTALKELYNKLHPEQSRSSASTNGDIELTIVKSHK